MTEPVGRVIEVKGLRPVVVFPREAVLEIEHVAAAFGISKRQAERRRFRCFYEGTRTRRRLYMGHGARDITDLYERHEVERFLEEDAAKLRAYVFGATEKQPLKLEKSS